MQTIKGLAALLVVAAAVFAIAGTISLGSQATYAAKLRSSDAVATAGNAVNPATGAMSGGVTALNAGSKGPNATTNLTHQARRKTPRT